jgi:hypothetical protein
MKSNRMLFIFIPIVLMAGFGACKKETTNDPPPEASTDIETNKTNVGALEMVELKLKSGTFAQETYLVQIGGKDLVLKKLNDSTLLFLAPRLDAGNYQIVGAIDDKNIAIDLVLKQSTPPANPKEYSANSLTLINQDINGLIGEISQDSLGLQTNLDEVAQYYHSKYLLELNNFSQEEVENLSLLIQSNYAFFHPSKTGNKMTSLIPEEMFDEMRAGLESDLTKLRYAHEMIKLCLENPLTYIMLLVYVPKYCWAYGWCHYDLYKFQQLKMIKTNLDQLFELKSAEYEFFNNTGKTLQLRSKYRNVNQNDIGGGNPLAQQICIQDSWVIGSGTDANASFLIDKPVTLPSDMSTVPEALSNDFNPVHTNYLSLGNVSNPKVSLASFSKNGYDMVPVFSMQEKSNQSFNFDIVYSRAGVSPFVLTVPAKLMTKEVTIAGISIGNWTNVGNECPGFDASGVGQITIGYQGTFAEDGYFIVTHYWDNENDGVFEGSTGLLTISHDGIQINPLTQTATFAMGFCWGNAATVIKFEATYKSPSSGVTSNTMNKIVPRP